MSSQGDFKDPRRSFYARSVSGALLGKPGATGSPEPPNAIGAVGSEIELGMYIQFPTTAAPNFCDWSGAYPTEAFTDTDPGLTLFRTGNPSLLSNARALLVESATIFWGDAFRGANLALTPVTAAGAGGVELKLYLSNGDTNTFGDLILETSAASFTTLVAGQSRSTEFAPTGVGVEVARRLLGNDAYTGQRNRLQLKAGLTGANVITNGYAWLQIKLREMGGGW